MVEHIAGSLGVLNTPKMTVILESEPDVEVLDDDIVVEPMVKAEVNPGNEVEDSPPIVEGGEGSGEDLQADPPDFGGTKTNKASIKPDIKVASGGSNKAGQ